MKNRSWKSRSGRLLQKPLGILARASRKRKTYTFERLEDRFAFSATQGPVDPNAVSAEAYALAQEVWQRELDWALMQAANATQSVTPEYAFLALPTDPMFEQQWHLHNTGQEVGNPDLQALFGVAGEDINVVGAWNLGYTGKGVTVGVFDSGVQLFHPDLMDNIHPTLRLNATTGTSNASPSLIDPAGPHGTAVAGIIGAVANNGIGGSGIAPEVTIVPIRRDFTSILEEVTAFQWAMQNDIDITNNSWGPVHSFHRGAFPLRPDELEILRNSVVFGRDGLGMIHVFSSGNDAGPVFSPGFGVVGNYDSASYNAWVNSRYTIGVTGVDHDGLYINADGTFTTYPAAGPSVLVAAPTGSNGFISVGEDDGYGSGIWTADLVGDFGYNGEPSESGFDPDSDPWPDPDYTSRFNGTSAAAPMVSGVIALMLEANPNLTYRDVQEILVRSSRQNAQFEFPASGGLGGTYASQNTWQTNQIGPFRDPDPWIPESGQSPVDSLRNPIANPNIEGFFGGPEFAPDRNDGGRQFGSHYEPQPPLFTNGAGYTVSQGYGVYNEQIGYGHGVVDAELAVRMAEQWHSLGQDMAPLTERTYTTSVVVTAANLPAAEKGAGPPNGINMIVPGGIYGLGGFIEYWNEYFADDDPADPEDGPFSGDDPPVNTRGRSYIDFAVPPDQAIDIEWVEVKLDISGPAEDLDFLRIFLTSPEGTQSEFNNFYLDPDFSTPLSLQPISSPPARLNPGGDIDLDGGTFVWTFSTNRSWGESTNTSLIIDPVTGEPLLATDPFTGLPEGPIFRDWELHIENWSNSDFGLNAVEIVWHGKPIAGGALDENWNVARAQRVQGFVGIDTNNDEEFNFSRYIQTITDTDGDPDTIRLLDVQRQLDFTDNNLNGVYDPAFDVINQEPFAENILVEAFRVDPNTGIVDADATARFLTGADGNYYFDLDPTFEYEIRITDPEGRIKLDDFDQQAGYMKEFQTSWRITPDWFYAADRDNPIVPGDNPGEIFYGMNDANGDGIMTEGPMPFMDLGAAIPMAVKNINFLLKEDAPPNQFDIAGTVYADVNGDGIFNGDDVPAPGITVYYDVNRNGIADAGEDRVETDANGQYLLTIPTTAKGTFQVGVIPPTGDWIPTDPGGDAVQSVFAGPGSPTQIVNFFLDPPNDAFPPTGTNEPGNILGVVYNDLDEDGMRDAGEGGLSGVRVFIDANENGVWDDATELSVLTSSQGSFFFADLAPNELYRIDVHIENENTPNAAWRMTQPSGGFHEVQVGPGGTVTGIRFGLENRADRDWGDLPDSFHTSAAANGPSHFVVPGFRLGSGIDGEVNGVPSAAANSDDLVGDTDDGIVVLSGGGVLQPGVNLVEVTVFGVGGLLTGWIDWNKNGTFDAATERIQWRDANGNLLGVEADLNPGTWTLQVIAPPDAVGGSLGARFRWGESGLGPTGPAQIGEVEDYFLSYSPVPISGLAGDYNNNNVVDNGDYIVWRRFVGSNISLPNDTTPGSVTQADYAVWRANFGATAPGAGGGASGSQLVTEDDGAPLTPNGGGAVSNDPVPVFSDVASLGGSGDGAADGAAELSLLSRFAPLAPTSDGPSTATADAVFTLAAFESNEASDLLLLDEAFADEREPNEMEPIRDRFSNDDEAGDLALASAFEDNANWWSL